MPARYEGMPRGPWFGVVAWLMFITACDEPQTRPALPGLDLQAQDASPGGSHCRGCVVGFHFGAEDGTPYLDLCVDIRVKFTGSLAEAVDRDADVPWIEVGNWSLRDGDSGAPICDDCEGRFRDVFGTHGVYRYTGVEARESNRLQMVLVPGGSAVSADETRLYPTVLADRGPSEWSCPPPQTKFDAPLEPRRGAASPTRPANIIGDEIETADELAGALAHIAYDWPHGGIRSCSGVLVAADAVITAAHCFEGGVEAEDLRVTVGLLEPLRAAPHEIVPARAIVEDDSLDLAVVRLADTVSTVPARLAAPGDPACSSRVSVHGYGVGDDDGHLFDWGRRKATALEWVAKLCADPAGSRCLDTSELLALMPPDDLPAALHGFCHGDSGGPVVQTCSGRPRVVGLATARVVAEPDRTSSPPALTTAGPAGPRLESVAMSFAFSRHNVCGQRGAVGFAATRVDSDRVGQLVGDD